MAVETDFTHDLLGRLTGISHHQGATQLAGYALAWSGFGSAAGAQAATAWQPTGGLPADFVDQGMLPMHDTTGIVDAICNGVSFAGLDLLTDVTSNDGSVHYSYDPTGQLTGADYSGGLLPNESYAWDANGNPTGTGYVIGADNRLLSDGTFRYAYDPEGNRTARFVDVDADGLLDAGDTNITQYGWDARNRLVKVTDRAAFGGSPTQVVDYLFDVENRWIGSLVDSNGDGQLDRQTRFAYDGTQIALQFDKDSSLLSQAGEGLGMRADGVTVTAADLSHRYLWQPNAVDQLMADEQLLEVVAGGVNTAHDLTQPGNVVLPLADHLGTIRDLAALDAQTGVTAVVNHREYSSFGKLESQTNATVDCLFGFTGRPLDKASATSRSGTRPYDPSTARWLTEDWIDLHGRDTNTSRFCANRPTSLTDPTGAAVSESADTIVSQLLSFVSSFIKMPNEIAGNALKEIINLAVAADLATNPNKYVDGAEHPISLSVTIPLGTIGGMPSSVEIVLTGTARKTENENKQTVYKVTWNATTEYQMGEIKVGNLSGLVDGIANSIKALGDKGIPVAVTTLQSVVDWVNRGVNTVVDRQLRRSEKTLHAVQTGDWTPRWELLKELHKERAESRKQFAKDVFGKLQSIGKKAARGTLRTEGATEGKATVGAYLDGTEIATLTVTYGREQSPAKWNLVTVDGIKEWIKDKLASEFGSENVVDTLKKLTASVDAVGDNLLKGESLQVAIDALRDELRKTLRLPALQLPLTFKYTLGVEFNGTITL